MVLFGFYYLLKPLVIILTQKSWYKNFDLDYKIEPDKIIVQSGKSKSELDYSDLKKVLKRKTYFALKTKSDQGIYLPIKLLSPNETEILNKLKN
nr:YcxB family protein [Muricauda sp. CAU 1633]